MNTRFEYMYRDSANWKNFGSVVFAGGLTPEIRVRFDSLFEPGDSFIAQQIGIPEVFLWDPTVDYDRDDPPAGLMPGNYVIGDEDHCFHEFCGIEEVSDDETPTDPRTIAQFVEDVAIAKKAGWAVFAPTDRCSEELRERLLASGIC